MVAISRMQSSFKLLGKGSNSPLSPTSPQESKVISNEADTDKKLSTLSPNFDGEKTPSASCSSLVIPAYDDAVSPTDVVDSATPTATDVFNYPQSRDRKFNESITEIDESTTPQVSPSTSEKDGMSDTMDSGYEGRKSTKELVTDSEVEHCSLQPVFLQQLPEEIHVIEGDCARLDVEVDNLGDATIAWYHDGVPLEMTDLVEVENDDKKYSLILRNIKLSDDAEYECRITSEFGENSTFGELYVVRNT